jgi:hypothetical protein
VRAAAAAERALLFRVPRVAQLSGVFARIAAAYVLLAPTAVGEDATDVAEAARAAREARAARRAAHAGGGGAGGAAGGAGGAPRDKNDEAELPLGAITWRRVDAVRALRAAGDAAPAGARRALARGWDGGAPSAASRLDAGGDDHAHGAPVA